MAARDALGQGSVNFGDHHLTVLVRENGFEALDEAAASCSAALADTGAIVVREDTNLEPAFWGQFPGNEQYLVRRAMISTANMARLRLASWLRRWVRQRATIGVMQLLCWKQPVRRLSFSIFTMAILVISPSSARADRAKLW